MKHYDKYERVIAIKERSGGNETVGDMWLEAKTFDKETPIKEIVEWSKGAGGRLIIAIDDTDTSENDLDF